MNATLLVAILVLGAVQGPSLAQSPYEFKVHKEITIVPVQEKSRTVFLVTNPSGIGQATIKLSSKQWPDKVTVRFQYKKEKGNGFTSLEHIRITTDHIYTEGSHGLSGNFPFFFLDSKGQKPFEVIDDQRAAGRLKILVEKRDGAIEVALPTHLLTGSTQIHVYWIDAYRK
jgi:hypothetical protein